MLVIRCSVFFVDKFRHEKVNVSPGISGASANTATQAKLSAERREKEVDNNSQIASKYMAEYEAGLLNSFNARQLAQQALRNN